MKLLTILLAFLLNGAVFGVVKGYIGKVSLDSSEKKLNIYGWACDTGKELGIYTHLYVGGGVGKGKLIAKAKANKWKVKNISKVCATTESAHRFHYSIPRSTFKTHMGKKIFIYGISGSGGKNLLIGRSAYFNVPKLSLLYVSDLEAREGNLEIPSDKTYILDTNITTSNLIVKGTLKCPTNTDKYLITAKAISIYGKFICGTASSRFTGELDFRLKSGLELEGAHGSLGSRAFLVHSGGELHLYGKKKNHSWLKLRLDHNAWKGRNFLKLEYPVDWSVGDKIAVSSTGFHSNQAEEFKIKAIENKGRKILLDGVLKYDHLAKVKNYSQSENVLTYDSRAVVANLSRNIRLYPYLGTFDKDELGAHAMVMTGGKAYIDSVEFSKMGRKGEMARYPFHWHLLGNANGQFIKNSSIHDSFQRCITIHGTNNVKVENNICYNHFGHGYFLEDGSEVGNILSKNVGFKSKLIDPGKALLVSDTLKGGKENRFPSPSTYWISNPKNTVVDNIAAGSEGTGFWMAFENKTICNLSACSVPSTSKTIAFDRNTAHSNKVGISWDGAPGTQSANNPLNPDDRILGSGHYRPRVKASFDQLIAFKNSESGIYFRGNAARFTNTLLADNARGFFVAYSQHLKDSVVVGKSSFYSRLDLNHFNSLGGKVGVIIYDGPFELENVSFMDFPTKEDSNALSTVVPIKGIGGATRFENKVKGLTFSPEPWKRVDLNIGNFVNWGDQWNSTSIRDIDGSLTGEKGGIVVPKQDFNYSPSLCYIKNGWDDSYICKSGYKIGLLQIYEATPNNNKVYFAANNIEGKSKFLSTKYLHNKMNIMTNRKDGYYSLTRKAHFERAQSFRLRFQTEGANSSSVVRIVDAGHCSLVDKTKFSSLNQLYNNKEGYFIKNGDLYIKLLASRMYPTHKNAVLSDVYFQYYNISCS